MSGDGLPLTSANSAGGVELEKLVVQIDVPLEVFHSHRGRDPRRLHLVANEYGQFGIGVDPQLHRAGVGVGVDLSSFDLVASGRFAVDLLRAELSIRLAGEVAQFFQHHQGRDVPLPCGYSDVCLGLVVDFDARFSSRKDLGDFLSAPEFVSCGLDSVGARRFPVESGGVFVRHWRLGGFASGLEFHRHRHLIGLGLADFIRHGSHGVQGPGACSKPEPEDLGEVSHDKLGLLGGLNRDFGTRHGRDLNRDAVDEPVTVTSRRSPFFSDDFARDTDNPEAELIWRSESGEVLKGPQETLLREVLNRGTPRGAVRYNGTDQARVPVIKPAECFAVASQGPRHEISVRRIAVPLHYCTSGRSEEIVQSSSDDSGVFYTHGPLPDLSNASINEWIF